MSVLLVNLQAAVRDMADIPGNPSVEDPTIVRWVNRGIERAYKIAKTANPSLFQASTPFTLVGGSGQNTVAVPATLRSLIHVAKDPTNAALRRTLRKYNADEKEGASSLSYRREGSLVVIEPFLACAGSYALYYAAGPTVLTGLNSALDPVLEPAAEYIETYAAIKCMDKEESESRNLRADLAELKDDLMVEFANVDAGTAETIIDVDNIGNRWPWDLVP
jgi:hypothetical protein